MANDVQQLNNLSDKEKQLALQILDEIAQSGNSEKYSELLYADFNEIPVDIITFIKDNRYLGKAWHTPSGKCKLFSYWENKLKELFPDNLTTNYNTAIFSGARGLGKSEIAVTSGLYLMYRLMCLKNPQEYLNLKPTEKAVFAFMNIKLDLAEEIGITKLQNTVQMSPWFMSRGTVTGRTKLVWNPPDFIEIKIGSDSSAVLGLPVLFCLDGETIIQTSEGEIALKDAVDKQLKVYTVDEQFNVTLSDTCTVKMTGMYQDEYHIELEDGTILKCTPNHRLMLTDGTYKEAQELTEQDDILDFKPYGYIYKTTNKINGKIYVGQKKSLTFLAEKYLGSGKVLLQAVKKYGQDNFNVELLQWCKDKTELDSVEKDYISKYNSTVEGIGYNIASGGQGGNLGPECCKRISEAAKGRVCKESTKQKLRDINLGKKLSPETRKKISVKNLNKKFTPEHISAIIEGCKRRSYVNYHGVLGRIAITNGTSTIFINKTDDIPDGWHRGNCFTSGKHDMSNYTDVMRQKRQELSCGKNNNMYGKGYKFKGGLNPNAKYRYIFKDKVFECRNDLLDYFQTEGLYVPSNAIINIMSGQVKKRTAKKYEYVIDNLKWEEKSYEN